VASSKLLHIFTFDLIFFAHVTYIQRPYVRKAWPAAADRQPSILVKPATAKILADWDAIKGKPTTVVMLRTEGMAKAALQTCFSFLVILLSVRASQAILFIKVITVVPARLLIPAKPWPFFKNKRQIKVENFGKLYIYISSLATFQKGGKTKSCSLFQSQSSFVTEDPDSNWSCKA
jgi:hypothetical protein